MLSGLPGEESNKKKYSYDLEQSKRFCRWANSSFFFWIGAMVFFWSIYFIFFHILARPCRCVMNWKITRPAICVIFNSHWIIFFYLKWFLFKNQYMSGEPLWDHTRWEEAYGWVREELPPSLTSLNWHQMTWEKHSWKFFPRIFFYVTSQFFNSIFLCIRKGMPRCFSSKSEFFSLTFLPNSLLAQS